MQSRNNVVSGYWFTDGIFFGAPYHYVDARVRKVDQLTVFVNVTTGDHRTPNGHEYYKVVDNRYYGTHSYRIDGIQADIREQGAIGYQVSLEYDYQVHDWTVYDRCLDDLYEAARGSIDLSVDIYQSRQAYAMVKSAMQVVSFVNKFPQKALKKSYDYFRKRGSKGIGKDAGGLWLEYTYGVRPLCQTVYDTALELNRTIPPLLKLQTQASSKNSRNYSKPFAGNASFLEVIQSQTQTRCKMCVTFKASAEATTLLGKFTSLNPASFIWENVPFSFVADWFYDVGGYMRNLESAYLYSNAFQSGYWVATFKSTTKGVVNQTVNGVNQDYDQYSLSGDVTISSKVRRLFTTAPSPRPPTFKTNLSSGRLMNAAALLSQFLKG